MTSQHWHVHAGLRGCLPSYSATCTTHEEAKTFADDFAEQCAESAAQVNWKGPLFDLCDPDFMVALDITAGVEYIEVVPCTDRCIADCDACDQNCIVVNDIGSCGLWPSQDHWKLFDRTEERPLSCKLDANAAYV